MIFIISYDSCHIGNTNYKIYSYKGIIDSIQFYFDFLDDLMNLGLVSPDSLNNLNDFYMGKLRIPNLVI